MPGISEKGDRMSDPSSSELSEEDDVADELSHSSNSAAQFTNSSYEAPADPNVSLFSSDQSSPGKKRRSQVGVGDSQSSLNYVPQRKAARDGNQRRVDNQTSTDSSSTSSDEGTDYECDGSPKKKTKQGTNSTKSKAKVPMNKGRNAIQSKRLSLLFAADNTTRSSSEPYNEAAILQSQEENRARLEEMDRLLASSQASTSSSTEVPRRAEELLVCPFCREDMPEEKSEELRAMMQYWLDLYHQKRRIGSTDTVEACQRHRNEAEIIPYGRAKGWRTRLNENRLRAQVRNEKNEMIGVMRERILNPISSQWMNKIVATRKKLGRQAETTLAQMQNIQEMQAGYYGERGWEILRNLLIEDFVDFPASPKYDLKALSIRHDNPLQRLSPQSFVERVLLPELVLMLIIIDQKAKSGPISMEDAKKIRDESANYGMAMFPSSAMGTVLSGRSAFGEEEVASFSRSRKPGSITPNKDAINTIGSKIAASGKVKLTPPSPSKVRNPQDIKSKNPHQSGSQRGAHLKPSSSLPQPIGLTRPRPRPVARKAASEAPSASVVTLNLQNSNDSLTNSSQQLMEDSAGEDHGNPIVISPTKSNVCNLLDDSSSSSNDSMPKVSLLQYNKSPHLDSPLIKCGSNRTTSNQEKDRREHFDQREATRQWRRTGIHPNNH